MPQIEELDDFFQLDVSRAKIRKGQRHHQPVRSNADQAGAPLSR